MGSGRTEHTVRSGAGTLALTALALALGGCGTASDLLKSSPLDYFSSSSKATNDAAAAGGTANITADDIDCPEVQLRIAVVQEGVSPKAVASKFGHETVTVNASIDRVTFTHVESDIAFPLPQPLGLIDAYVVYVGFDPVSAQPEKKKPPAKRKPVAKKPAAKPKQS